MSAVSYSARYSWAARGLSRVCSRDLLFQDCLSFFWLRSCYVALNVNFWMLCNGIRLGAISGEFHFWADLLKRSGGPHSQLICHLVKVVLPVLARRSRV